MPHRDATHGSVVKKRSGERVCGLPKPVISTMSHFSIISELDANVAQKGLSEEDQIYRKLQHIPNCPDIRLSYRSISNLILRKKNDVYVGVWPFRPGGPNSTAIEKQATFG